MKEKSTKKISDNTRWRRRKDERPGEILHAALECFGERGFAATKLDDVAMRAGVTKGTLYLYFSNKEDLFKAVISGELVPKLVEIEKRLTAANLSASDSLRMLLLFVGQTLTKSHLSRLPKLVISEVGNFPELAKFYLEEVITRGFGMIGGILRRGIESGEFRAVNVENTIYCIIAPVLFSMLYKHSLEPHAERKLDLETLYETHLEMILRGLKPDSKT